MLNIKIFSTPSFVYNCIGIDKPEEYSKDVTVISALSVEKGLYQGEYTFQSQALFITDAHGDKRTYLMFDDSDVVGCIEEIENGSVENSLVSSFYITDASGKTVFYEE